jgi:hypothetical protein
LIRLLAWILSFLLFYCCVWRCYRIRPTCSCFDVFARCLVEKQRQTKTEIICMRAHVCVCVCVCVYTEHFFLFFWASCICAARCLFVDVVIAVSFVPFSPSAFFVILSFVGAVFSPSPLHQIRYWPRRACLSKRQLISHFQDTHHSPLPSKDRESIDTGALRA